MKIYFIRYFLFLVILSFFGCRSFPGLETEIINERTVQYALKGKGSPTVIFENGLGANLDYWQKIFEEISQKTRVFAYNRPGYGKSFRVSTPREGKYIVIELRDLLRKLGIKGPYILVGHSYGGLLMQLFARQYPQDVAALILVDSTHPEHFKGEGSPEKWPKLYRDLFNLVTGEAAKAEFYNINRTGEEVLELPAPSGIPVMILSAFKPLKKKGKAADYENEKRRDLVKLYPGARQVWVNSGHNIPKEKPDAVIKAVMEYLK